MKYRLAIYAILFLTAVFSLAYYFPEERITILLSSFMAASIGILIFVVVLKKKGDTKFLKSVITIYLILSILAFILKMI
jgi:hypothetical protein